MTEAMAIANAKLKTEAKEQSEVGQSSSIHPE